MSLAPILTSNPVDRQAVTTRRSPVHLDRSQTDLAPWTCRRHYPGGPLGRIARGTAYSNRFPARQRLRPSLSLCKVGIHIGRFEACSTFTRVTACLLAASPKRRICLEGSDGFVTSTAAPIATGGSDPVAGWELHPRKTNTFARRTQSLTPGSTLGALTGRLGETKLVTKVLCPPGMCWPWEKTKNKVPGSPLGKNQSRVEV